MDKFEHRFQGNPAYHTLLLPVEAALPRLPEEEDTDKIPREEAINEESDKKHRVSREELYSEIKEGLNIGSVFLAMTILSSVVAGSAWDREAFRILGLLFQVTVTDVSDVGIPITIAK
jgi:hypothetical protein